MRFFKNITGVRPENWDALIETKRFDNVYRLIIKYYEGLPVDASKECGQMSTNLKQNKWLTKALNEVKDLTE